ncbi:hypothetical protein ACFX2I_037155 [Malus domestica]
MPQKDLQPWGTLFLGALIDGSGRALQRTCKRFSAQRGSLTALVLPPQKLVEHGGGVIDQTPDLKKFDGGIQELQLNK